MEEDDGLVKDQGKEMVGGKENSSLEGEAQDKHQEATMCKLVESYRPLVPFIKRLAKAKCEAKFVKFLEVPKKLQINISFLEGISEMPSNTKLFKESSLIRGSFKRM